MYPEHTCLGNAPVKWKFTSSISWLSEEVPKLISVTPKTSTKDIVDIILKRHGHTIELQQAQKVKAFLLNNNLAVHAEDFQKLPAYLDALKNVNPELYTNLSIRTDGETFHRIFICPYQSNTAFHDSLPFVSLDGTFLKTQFRQTLLFAVGRDLNNQIYLLAWAVVESENEQSWRYFLRHLKIALPAINDLTTVIITDRDKGLQAAQSELNLVTVGWCSQHIKANVIRKHGEAAGAAFMRLAGAKDEASWNSAIALLAQTRDGPRAVSYVNSIDKTK